MSATENTAAAAGLQLQPYIFFYGRAEEALEFYKRVFGGSFEIMRNSETPMADQTPENYRNKVMHASFTAPGVSFYASDGREAKTVNPDEGNVSIALNAGDAATGDRVFAALAEGGKVVMPLEAAFWGGRFGMIQDKFGLEWMITSA